MTVTSSTVLTGGSRLKRGMAEMLNGGVILDVNVEQAQVRQSLSVDYIDQSEVLTPADYTHHIDKWNFTVPFVCGATNLGEALRRINEGAAMIRSKGEASTNVDEIPQPHCLAECGRW